MLCNKLLFILEIFIMKISHGISFLSFFLFSLSLVLPSGYSIGAALLVIYSLLLMPRLLSGRLLAKQDKLLLLVFLVYGLSMVGFVFYDQFAIRELDMPSRFLFICPVLLLLLKFPFKKEYIFYGFIVGAVSGFGYALYEKIVLVKSRVYGLTHGVIFGDVSMLFGLVCLIASFFFFARQIKLLAFLALLGCFSGILSSMLSITRGAWIPLPVALIVILLINRRFLDQKKIYAVFLSIFCILLLMWLLPQTGVANRINKTLENISAYQEGNKFSSFGHRIEMWKASLYMLEESPVLGVGKSNVQHMKQEFVEKGLVDKGVLIHRHAHSDYFDTIALRGLIGFLLLVMLYLVPLILFLMKIRENPGILAVRSYGCAGAIIPICYMGFGLTDSLFRANITIILYLFSISFFWAALRWSEREVKGKNTNECRAC